MAENQDYVIRGQVIHTKSKQGFPQLRIEAYDKDCLSKDDYLGSAQTNDEDCFIIRFSTKKHRAWIFDTRPDLYFRVYEGKYPDQGHR